jgi:TolB protein
MDAIRKLLPGQISRLHIGSIDARESTIVLETDEILVDAPNWTVDGTRLIVNGDGLLWAVRLQGDAVLEGVVLEGIPPLNNDHVLAPDGDHIFLSANDGHIYDAALRGGPVRRITNVRGPRRLHFLHGVSPDGTTLAYIGIDLEGDDRWASANVFTIPGRADGTRGIECRAAHLR